ncbi:Nucleotide-binding universal stress protein, UspA family [Marinococcus luteus]|jgi:nucleotide-binding universal stress UspA family protein|uniref:Nucleotide-binding universal stress protein, UspA family n=1 Tax=Marinococcus luteus TaxID=1122204 RepID=A0A1H2VAY7_9BACI|nr:universal stress protein [Marinococcus luteus]SDW65094.1 Nucleotide-binding universal stress protein, UspA family [Marinococcus luteus]
MFKRLLIAVDGSDHSARAVEKAIESIAPVRAEIYVEVVYATASVQPKSNRLSEHELYIRKQNEEEILQPAVERLSAEGIRAEKVVLHGDPAAAISEYANEYDFDCVVVGSRGLNPLQKMVIGSVSRKIVEQIRHPVLVVK